MRTSRPWANSAVLPALAALAGVATVTLNVRSSLVDSLTLGVAAAVTWCLRVAGDRGATRHVLPLWLVVLAPLTVACAGASASTTICWQSTLAACTVVTFCWATYAAVYGSGLTPGESRLVLGAFGLVAAVVCVTALREWAQSGLLPYPALQGCLRNGNPLAGYLPLAFAVWLSLWVSLPPRPYGWTQAMLLVVGTMCLLLTSSRVSYLMLVAVLVAFVGVSARESRRRVAGLLLVTTLSALLLIVALTRGGFLLGIARDMGDLEKGRASDSVAVRLSYLKDATRMAAAHPLVGTGPGTFRWIYARRSTTRTYSIYAHDFVLEYAVEYGAPFAVIYLALLCLALRATWRGRDRSAANRYVPVGVLALLCHSLLNFDWSIAPVAASGVFLLGITAPQGEYPNGSKAHRGSRAVITLIAVLAIASGAWSVTQLAGLARFATGKHLQDRKLYRESIQPLEASTRLMPLYGLTWSTVASSYLGEAALARDHASRSRLVDMGIRSAQHAIRLNPLDDESHVFLVRLLLWAGRPQGARLAYAQACRVLGSDSPLERRTLSDLRALIESSTMSRSAR